MKRNDREEKTRRRGRRGTPGNSWWGRAARLSKILTLFQTKKCHFSHPFSDLASKKLCHHYLDRRDKNSNKNYFLKSISNSHISLPFLLIWN